MHNFSHNACFLRHLFVKYAYNKSFPIDGLRPWLHPQFLLCRLRYPPLPTVALQLAVTGRNDYTPIENAIIQITDTGNPDNIIEELTTDNSGETPTIDCLPLLFLTVWRAAVPNPIQSIISPFRLKVIPI